jgi:hypothetical protein
LKSWLSLGTGSSSAEAMVVLRGGDGDDVVLAAAAIW